MKVLCILAASAVIAAFAVRGSATLPAVSAQSVPAPAPTPEKFDQAEAISRIREEIKGKEREPSETVFKNIRSLKGIPAGRLLAVMEMGYSRSLGVDCRHCHVPGQWDSEEKKAKQIAREMSAMASQINASLKGIKGIDNPSPAVNCTTCHRGQLKPALNLPQ